MHNNLEKIARKRSKIYTVLIMAILILLTSFMGMHYQDPPLQYAIAIEFPTTEEESFSAEQNFPEQASIQEKNTFEKTAGGESGQIKASGTPNNIPSIKGKPEQVVTQHEQSPIKANKTDLKHPTKDIGTTQGNTQNKTFNSAPQNTRAVKINRGSGGQRGGTGTGNDRNILDHHDGNLGGMGGSGSGSGNGAGTSFGNGSRKLIVSATINFDDCPNSSDYGNIVSRYQVAQDGKIILSSINYSAQGTQVAINSCIQRKIYTFLSKIKYSPGNKAVESTTYTFKLKPKN